MERGFDCYRDCVRDGDFDDGERASRGCTHPGLPPVPWDVVPDRLVYYLGREASLADSGKDPPPNMGSDWWMRPPEPKEDGCPAGWILSPFAMSAMRYVRRRTEHGGRVDNPRFTATTDRVAHEAALYYEEQQERLVNHRNHLIAEKMKRDNDGSRTA